jgi:hypothetical protein
MTRTIWFAIRVLCIVLQWQQDFHHWTKNETNERDVSDNVSEASSVLCSTHTHVHVHET